ncbi:hypothetical protein [Aeoliella sp. SH292]|uniref:hypothetical protein n=1 Tax=Aeoliella sp. SH292 TaxID=3454464 RepID=UPI003F9BB943
MHKIVPLVLLVIAGCTKTSAPALPPTAGDFVKNNDGVGTAQVFGIDFSVRANSSGVSTDDTINADFTDPKQSRASKRFTLGDDVAIQLESVNASEVRFQFNDQDFGILKVGDKVVIDDERNVEVNGTPRSPQPAE